MRALLTVVSVLTLFQVTVGLASAQASFCQSGEQPTFRFGFGTLKEQLGPAMGSPVECEHPNSANGDTLQKTTTGLAFYRKSTNTPTFTDGYRHWALTVAGVASWEGDAVDPPASVLRANVAVPPFAAFAGVWGSHGFTVTMWEDGHGQAEWRTYQFCGPGVIGACDRAQGGYLLGGGQAYFNFESVQGSVARGRVLSSTDTESLHPGAVTLTLMPYGLAELEQGSFKRTLCGPRYLDEAPETVRRSLPCGA